MTTLNRSLFVLLILFLAMIPGFSQDAKTAAKAEKKTQSDSMKEESLEDGLIKITTHTFRDRDVDIKIDEEALEANIERAVEDALRSVEVALEKLEIRIDPIEINLGDLDMDMNPIEINIPELNIDIEPIEIDLDDLDIDLDIDIDEDNEEDDDRDDDREKFRKDEKYNWDKDKHSDKPGKGKDKTKGLKKIN